MRCLSIQQPWAQYIAAGIKDVENRSWGLKTFPQRVLIHTGKKKQSITLADFPLLWALPIENAEHSGIVPFVEDMPTGAIIGVVDIIGCSVDDKSLAWSQWSDDPEHPMYNLKLANAKLFKEPIMDVKGKQGIFEYPDITEDNLPETVDIPIISRVGNELFMPLAAEELPSFKTMGEEGATLDYHLLDSNLHLFALNTEDGLEAIPTEYVTLFNEEDKVRTKVKNIEIAFIQDEDGNDIIFEGADGKELAWVKIFYSLIPA